MDDKDKGFDEEYFGSLSTLMEALLKGIFNECGKMKADMKNEVLTRLSKHPEHIFADTEMVGKKSEVEYLKETITGFSVEREKFQAEAEENEKQNTQFSDRYYGALKEWAAAAKKYEQLKMQYEEMKVLLEIDKDEQARQRENLKELDRLKKKIEGQRSLIDSLRKAVKTVQSERDQFRKCVNAIRIRLGSVPKGSAKGKLEEFVSCVKEAISEIST